MVTELSRKLRRQATTAERAFWKMTYTWRQAGWHFRRQFNVGSYYVDFACISAGLIVEIDGDTHGPDLARSNDAVRDDYLEGRGFVVMRFSNEDVLKNPNGVFSMVAAHLETRVYAPPPQPSPQGGGSAVALAARAQNDRQPNLLPHAVRAEVGGATRSNPDEA